VQLLQLSTWGIFQSTVRIQFGREALSACGLWCGGRSFSACRLRHGGKTFSASRLWRGVKALAAFRHRRQFDRLIKFLFFRLILLAPILLRSQYFVADEEIINIQRKSFFLKIRTQLDSGTMFVTIRAKSETR